MKNITNNLGWIKLHRKLLDWEWANDPIMLSVFIRILLEANHENKKWRGIDVARGQLIFGQDAFAERCGITRQQLRLCLNRLKTTSEITIKTTSKFSILTIEKYSEYQFSDIETTNKTTSGTTNEQPTNNQQTTTTKEYKNIRNKEYIYPDTFEKFWNEYPYRENGNVKTKGSKKITFNEWKKISNDEHDNIFIGLAIYKKETDKRFIKDAERFLRDEHWKAYEIKQPKRAFV